MTYTPRKGSSCLSIVDAILKSFINEYALNQIHLIVHQLLLEVMSVPVTVRNQYVACFSGKFGNFKNMRKTFANAPVYVIYILLC